MKTPHSPSEKDDIDIMLDSLEAHAVDQVRRAEQLGEDRQRIEFFDILRKLIMEKDMAGDEIAVQVLSWAYDRLTQES